MIEKVKISNFATYSEPTTISNLKKINFIYGNNGSGKTTISNFIHDQSNPDYCDCSIIWKGGNQLERAVYNKKFREDNFNSDDISGVFTLGHATADDIKKIEELRKQRDEIKEEGIKKKETAEKQNDEKDKLESDFRDKVWINIYKKYENDFKEAFKGSLVKEKFKTKLLEEYKNNNSTLIDFTDIIKKAETVFGDRPEAINNIRKINSAPLFELEGKSIWSKVIIGKEDVEIGKIIQKLKIDDWVNKGRNFIENDNTCPFCQQPTISDDFKSQLEKYFDQSYIDDIKTVQDLGENYAYQSNIIESLVEQILTESKGDHSSKLDNALFEANSKALIATLNSNRQKVNIKRNEPSRKIEIETIKEPINKIIELINDANLKIDEHNQIVRNFDAERINLINIIWKYVIDENKSSIEEFIKKRNGLEKGIKSIETKAQELRDKYTELNKEIKELGKNVTSIQPSVDEINSLLKLYGFTNFSIVPSKVKNKYQIQREDGSLVESTLSEGEITFITFLYYLQRTKGGITEDSVSSDRVLIIDDPISSLDSNILFVVSTLIKEIIKGIKFDTSQIKQLILLTHNVYFHKEVSFIDGRTKECKDTNYWILRKEDGVSRIYEYGQKNPISTSYELLWSELKNKDNVSSITIQNTMRRIIENYFKLLGKYGDDQLINKFTNKNEQEICRSLLCWINDGSHSIPDDVFIEDQTEVVNKYFDVFKRIFQETNHLEHYKMMMNITDDA